MPSVRSPITAACFDVRPVDGSPEQPMPIIVVHRPFDVVIVRVKIKIDGQLAARLKRGASQSFEVTPGRHVVRVHLNWQSSSPVELNLNATETVTLEAAVYERAWRFTETFLRQEAPSTCGGGVTYALRDQNAKVVYLAKPRLTWGRASHHLSLSVDEVRTLEDWMRTRWSEPRPVRGVTSPERSGRSRIPGALASCRPSGPSACSPRLVAGRMLGAARWRRCALAWRRLVRRTRRLRRTPRRLL